MPPLDNQTLLIAGAALAGLFLWYRSKPAPKKAAPTPASTVPTASALDESHDNALHAIIAREKARVELERIRSVLRQATHTPDQLAPRQVIVGGKPEPQPPAA